MEKIKMLITFIPHCSELNEEELREDIMMTARQILDCYDVRSDLFVFKKRNRNEDVFITFKASIEDDQEQLENTKFINWKPFTNTFFSVNALNYLIMGEIGHLDTSHQVNWSKHRNKIIMLRTLKQDDAEDQRILSESKIRRYMRIVPDLSEEGFTVTEYKNRDEGE